MIRANFKVTQGSNDAATEEPIATFIQPGISMSGWHLSQIQFTLSPNLVKSWPTTDFDLTLQVMKRSLGASVARVTSYDDDDLLLTYDLAGIASGTAANLAVMQCSHVVDFPKDLVVYAPYIYVQVISTGTGVQNIVWGSVRYDLVKLTQKEAFAALAGGSCS